MQFYSNSTQQKGDLKQHHVPIIPPKTSEQEAAILTSSPFSQNLYYFNHYCKELLEVSSMVNLQLIKNQQLLSMRAKLMPLQPLLEQVQGQMRESMQDRSQKDNSEDNSTASRKNNSDANEDQTAKICKPDNSERKKSRRVSNISSGEQYEPQEDQYVIEEPTYSRTSQSKNIPENYSKAIINFIRKNQQLTDKVLRITGTDRQEFMQSLESIKKRLGTIAQLQWLWTDSKNKFAKVYRILSMEYLRKHSLPYIFNSRVNIYGKHIKYRYRIIESVKDPQNFTHMKQF